MIFKFRNKEKKIPIFSSNINKYSRYKMMQIIFFTPHKWYAAIGSLLQNMAHKFASRYKNIFCLGQIMKVKLLTGLFKASPYTFITCIGGFFLTSWTHVLCPIPVLFVWHHFQLENRFDRKNKD